MAPSLKMRRGLLLLVVSGVLFFQNCSQPPDDSATTNSASRYQDSLPLAVNAQVDTIAHMSCSGITTSVEKRAYFSFRALAVSPLTGGLSLTQAFQDATKYYSNKDRAQALANSEVNGDTRVNFSIRDTANYQRAFQVDDDFRVGEEIESFLPPLANLEIAGPLAGSKGAMLNYFPGSGSKRLMEASLRYFKYDNTMKDVRTKLDSRESILVMGFSGSSDELDRVLKSPPDAKAQPGNALPVYGMGYFLNFALPVGNTAGERRVLSKVEEYDLATSPPGYINANWYCPTNFQFQVVRPQDYNANKALMRPTVDPSSGDARLEAIRRVLRVEDWFVDLTSRRVMPKRTGDYCYGDLGTRTIQYGAASCLNSTTTSCPHFVSVCIRR